MITLHAKGLEAGFLIVSLTYPNESATISFAQELLGQNQIDYFI